MCVLHRWRRLHAVRFDLSAALLLADASGSRVRLHEELHGAELPGEQFLPARLVRKEELRRLNQKMENITSCYRSVGETNFMHKSSFRAEVLPQKVRMKRDVVYSFEDFLGELFEKYSRFFSRVSIQLIFAFSSLVWRSCRSLRRLQRVEVHAARLLAAAETAGGSGAAVAPGALDAV